MFQEFEPPPAEKIRGELSPEKEKEEAVSYLILLRHAQRYSGEKKKVGEEVALEDSKEITPEGEKASREIGTKPKELQVDWAKFTGSTEKRTLQTGEWVGTGLVTGKKQPTRILETRGKAFYDYGDVLVNLAKLDPKIIKASKIIRENLPTDFWKFDAEERARIREKIQPIGLKSMLEDERIRQPLAEAMAYRLSNSLEAMRRVVDKGQRGLMAPVGHGVSFEALCKEALVREKPDGTRKIGFKDAEEMGGFLKPGEYFMIKMSRAGKVEKIRNEEGKVVRKDPGGEKLEFSFSDSERLKGEKYWLDLEKIEELALKMKQRIKAYHEEKTE